MPSWTLRGSDPFTRTDAVDIDGSSAGGVTWGKFGSGVVGITSNEAVYASGAAWYLDSAMSAVTDAMAELKVTGFKMGPAICMSGAAQTGYFVYPRADATIVYRVNAGSYSSLDASAAISLGQTVKLWRVSGLLYFSVDDVLVVNGFDDGINLLAAGKCGMFCDTTGGKGDAFKDYLPASATSDGNSSDSSPFARESFARRSFAGTSSAGGS